MAPVTTALKPGPSLLMLYSMMFAVPRTDEAAVTAVVVAAVAAGGQVGIDQPALGGVDGAQHVDAKRGPGLHAIPGLGHGASPRSCNASLSAFNA